MFSHGNYSRTIRRYVGTKLRLAARSRVQHVHTVISRVITKRLDRRSLGTLRFSQFEFTLRRNFTSRRTNVITLFQRVIRHLFRRKLMGVIFTARALTLNVGVPTHYIVIRGLRGFGNDKRIPLAPKRFARLANHTNHHNVSAVKRTVIISRHSFMPTATTTLSDGHICPLRSDFRTAFGVTIGLLGADSCRAAHTALSRSFTR